MMDDADAALIGLLEELRRRGYRHTAVTPLTHARVNARPTNAWACDLAGIFGWSRPFREELLPDGMLALMQRANILARHEDGWRSRLRVSSLAGTLFLHSAYPTTEADAVFFGPDTYRFTQAIDQLLADQRVNAARAADIGCGAGPGAVVLAQARPAAQVLALDINAQALRLARINAMFAGVAHVEPRHSNLLNDVEGDFDLIVANPPYLVDAAERAYRHGGGPLGAGLAMSIIESAAQRLAPGGTLLLYTGVAIVNGQDPFLQAVGSSLSGSGLEWEYRETDPDIFGEELLTESYAGTDRIAAVVLTAHRLCN